MEGPFPRLNWAKKEESILTLESYFLTACSAANFLVSLDSALLIADSASLSCLLNVV